MLELLKLRVTKIGNKNSEESIEIDLYIIKLICIYSKYENW